MVGNGKGLQGAAPTGALAPASFWEFYFAIYPLEKYLAIPRILGKRFNCGANGVASDVISVNIPIFVYAFRVDAWTQAAGTSATVRYAVGLKDATGIDFFNGKRTARAFGDGGTNALDVAWPLPLELAPSSDLTVDVDNTLNAAAAAITVEALLHGIQPVLRTKQLQTVG